MKGEDGSFSGEAITSVVMSFCCCWAESRTKDRLDEAGGGFRSTAACFLVRINFLGLKGEVGCGGDETGVLGVTTDGPG